MEEEHGEEEVFGEQPEDLES